MTLKEADLSTNSDPRRLLTWKDSDEVIADAVLQQPTAQTGPEKMHAPFSPYVRHIIRNSRVEIAGCDPDGIFLGDDALERDLHLMHAIERPLVLKPETVARQLDEYADALKAVKGNPLALDRKKFKFTTEGKHISHLPVPLLRDVVKKKNGYVLLVRYGAEGVPLGYNLGLASMPLDDPDLPNLDARKISVVPAEEVEWFVNNRDKIFENWRSGAVDTFSPKLCDELASLNIEVPPHLVGQTAQRMGISNIVKYVLAHAVLGWKERIMFNIGKIQRPGQPLDAAVAMPNAASIEAVHESFFEYQNIVRSHVDRIMHNDVHVGDMRWHLFGNEPQFVIANMERIGSVIRRADGKGWPLEHPQRVGQALRKFLQRAA